MKTAFFGSRFITYHIEFIHNKLFVRGYLNLIGLIVKEKSTSVTGVKVYWI